MNNKMQILPFAQVTDPGCAPVRVSRRAPLVQLQRPTDWSTLAFTYHSRNYLRCFCRSLLSTYVVYCFTIMQDWLTPSRQVFRVGPIPIKTTTPSPSGGWPQQKLLNAGFGIHHGRTWYQKECGCASVGVQQILGCKEGRRVWRSPSYHSAVIHLSCVTFSFIFKLMYYIIKYLNILSEFTMINS